MDKQGYELAREAFGINFGTEFKLKPDSKPTDVVNGTLNPVPGQKKPRRR